MADASVKGGKPDDTNEAVVEAQTSSKGQRRPVPRPRSSKTKPEDTRWTEASAGPGPEPPENLYEDVLGAEASTKAEKPPLPPRRRPQETPDDADKVMVGAGASVEGKQPLTTPDPEDPPGNLYETLTRAEPPTKGEEEEPPPGHESPYEDMEAKCESDWREDLTPWEDLCTDLRSKGEKERKVVSVKAEQLFKAVQVYVVLLCEHGGSMKELTHELLSVANNLDKVSKGSKIAGITGGATTAAGGVAAAAGVILAPFTLGVSLALTAVGVGVAAAGGVTGASAAIAHKVNFTQDKKKIENTTQQYKRLLQDIQDCLKYINEGMAQIKQHDLSVLSEARTETERVAKVIDMSATGETNARAIEVSMKASELIEAFTLGMGTYYVQKKKGQKLKKGLESKFAKKIRTLVTELNQSLDDLMQMKESFSKICSEE